MDESCNHKTYICDYIDLIRESLVDNNFNRIHCYLDNIQFLAQRMEDVLKERKEKLIEEGYIKCPLCGAMSVPEFDHYTCCGFIKN